MHVIAARDASHRHHHTCTASHTAPGRCFLRGSRGHVHFPDPPGPRLHSTFSPALQLLESFRSASALDDPIPPSMPHLQTPHARFQVSCVHAAVQITVKGRTHLRPSLGGSKLADRTLGTAIPSATSAHDSPPRRETGVSPGCVRCQLHPRLACLSTKCLSLKLSFPTYKMEDKEKSITLHTCCRY